MPTNSTSDVTRIGFSATLRVMCAADRHDEIEDVTGLTATHQHEHGAPSFFGEPWPRDLWALESPLPPDASLSDHLDWLWAQVQPHQEYFQSLAAEEGVEVDLFCGYRSDCAECGFAMQPEALRIVQALSIPLEVSVVFT